jgi:hypothetical protein
MNTYTLNDLQTIFNAKGYLPYERFLHYFTIRYGYTTKQAEQAYKAFVDFPKQIYLNDEQKAIIDEVIPKAIAIVDELFNCWENNREIQNIKLGEKDIRKLIYQKGEDIKELIIDIYHAEDIITYAELLKQGVKQFALLKFCTEVQILESKEYLKIFEGDIFNTNDSWYGIKSRVFVAQSVGTFKEILYTKGKGYLSKGELNYNEGSFTPYVLREWTKIGNITTDLVKLTDDGTC